MCISKGIRTYFPHHLHLCYLQIYLHISTLMYTLSLLRLLRLYFCEFIYIYPPLFLCVYIPILICRYQPILASKSTFISPLSCTPHTLSLSCTQPIPARIPPCPHHYHYHYHYHYYSLLLLLIQVSLLPYQGKSRFGCIRVILFNFYPPHLVTRHKGGGGGNRRNRYIYIYK